MSFLTLLFVPYESTSIYGFHLSLYPSHCMLAHYFIDVLFSEKNILTDVYQLVLVLTNDLPSEGENMRIFLLSP